MMGSLAIGIGAFAVAASLAASASGHTGASSAATCRATGSGMSFVLDVSIPSGTPAVGGFAIGGSGVTVTNINIEGVTGGISTQKLPAGTSLAQIDSSALPSGTATVDIATSDAFSGTFMVVPANFPSTTTYSTGIACPLGATVPTTASNVFTPVPKVVWDPTKSSWYQLVDMPGKGTVAFHVLIQAGHSPLIRAGKLPVKTSGITKLTLSPTALGLKTLRKTGSIKAKLRITYTPTGGKSASKTVPVNLRPKRS
jgi:hypothetical protein